MEYCKFLELYRKYSSGNETPELIHLWVGLSTLAGAAEKRIWLDRGFFEVFLNLYIIFISPPGVCAKSTGIGLGFDMLKRVGLATLEDSVLKERIVVDMMENQKSFEHEGLKRHHSSLTYYADELSTLLNSGIDMVKFLVAIYSKRDVYHYKTKNSGTYEVLGPYFNLIAATVPQWFGPSVASDMGTTGFLARCIIVYADKKRGKVPEPIVTPDQVRAYQDAMAILLKISDRSGPITLTEQATEFYNKWYVEQEPDPGEDPRIAGYLERKNKVHVLKISALMAIGDLKDQIEVIDIERAIHILSAVEKDMRMAYLVAGSNKLAPYVPRVMSLLDAHNGEMPIKIAVSAVLAELNSDEFKSLIKTMCDMEIIALEKNGNQTIIKRSANGKAQFGC